MSWQTFQSVPSSSDQQRSDFFPTQAANWSTQFFSSIRTLSVVFLPALESKFPIDDGDVDVVYDESPAHPSACEVEKAIEVPQQFTLFCDEGDDLTEVVSKVSIYSQNHLQEERNIVH